MVVGSGENVILLNPLSVLAPNEKQVTDLLFSFGRMEFARQRPPGHSDERGSLG